MQDQVRRIFPLRALDALDRLHAGILITDHDCRAVHANAQFCRMLGVTRDEIPGLDSGPFVKIQAEDASAAHAQQNVRVDVLLNGLPCSIVISTSEISPDLLMSVIQDVTRIVAEHETLRLEIVSLKEQLAALVYAESVPMCMTCNKVRLRDGSWVPVADPKALLSAGSVSHGFCPPCAETYFRNARREPS